MLAIVSLNCATFATAVLYQFVVPPRHPLYGIRFETLISNTKYVQEMCEQNTVKEKDLTFRTGSNIGKLKSQILMIVTTGIIIECSRL